MSRRTGWRVAGQVVVTGALLALALRLLDLDALRAALSEADWHWLPFALPLFTLAKYVDSWRWRYLLAGIEARPPQRALFGAFLIGNFVNNLAPLRLGDVAKIQVLANRYGASRAALAASVFVVESTLDGVVFVLVLLAAVAFWDLDGLEGVTGSLVAALAVVALVAFAAAVVLARARRVPLPHSLVRRVERVEAHFRSGLGALRSPGTVGVAVALSLPAWAIEAAMFAAVGEWVFGLGLPYTAYLAAMVAANVAVAVPLGLWNVGPYEALVAGALGLHGVDAATAVSVAAAVHLGTNAWIALTGVVAIWAMGVTPRQVFAIRATPPERDVTRAS